jgi:hypothetical protein
MPFLAKSLEPKGSSMRKKRMALPIASTPKLKGKNAENFIKKAQANSTALPSKEEQERLSKSLDAVLKAFSKPKKKND